jgi:hypothetical protein
VKQRYRKIKVDGVEYGWLATGEVAIRVGNSDKGKPRYGRALTFDPAHVFGGLEKPQAFRMAEWIKNNFATKSKTAEPKRGSSFPTLPGKFVVGAKYAWCEVVPGTGTLPDDWRECDTDELPRYVKVRVSYQDGSTGVLDLESFVLRLKTGRLTAGWPNWKRLDRETSSKLNYSRIGRNNV